MILYAFILFSIFSVGLWFTFLEGCEIHGINKLWVHIGFISLIPLYIWALLEIL